MPGCGGTSRAACSTTTPCGPTPYQTDRRVGAEERNDAGYAGCGAMLLPATRAGGGERAGDSGGGRASGVSEHAADGRDAAATAEVEAADTRILGRGAVGGGARLLGDVVADVSGAPRRLHRHQEHLDMRGVARAVRTGRPADGPDGGARAAQGEPNAGRGTRGGPLLRRGGRHGTAGRGGRQAAHGRDDRDLRDDRRRTGSDADRGPRLLPAGPAVDGAVEGAPGRRDRVLDPLTPAAPSSPTRTTPPPGRCCSPSCGGRWWGCPSAARWPCPSAWCAG